MKVYAITAGDYSDYHIVGVSTDLKFATDFCKRRQGEYTWTNYRVEFFDTDDIMCLTEKMHFWGVKANAKGEIWATEMDDAISYSAKNRNFVDSYTTIYGETFYEVHVVAEDEEHAKKIGYDLIMQSRYRKEIEEGR